MQELPAVEGLARVNVVCLDKTGTLTVGDIAYEDCEPCGDLTKDEITGGARCAGRRSRTPTAPCRRWPPRCRRRPAGTAQVTIAVQLGAQVERRLVHRPRVAGVRRARRAAGRGQSAARPGERTRRDRAAGAAAGPHRRPARRSGAARRRRSRSRWSRSPSRSGRTRRTPWITSRTRTSRSRSSPATTRRPWPPSRAGWAWSSGPTRSSTPGPSARSRRSCARSSSAPRCSAGSRPNRSARSCRRCSATGMSWR